MVDTKEHEIKEEHPKKVVKGSGLDELEVEQKEQDVPRRNNKLDTDEVKHH